MPSTISLYAVLGVAPNATLAEIPTAACWPRDGRRRWLLLIFWISGPAPAPHSPPGHRADDAGGYGAPARCPFGYRNDGANTADAADCSSQHDRRHCRASSPDRPLIDAAATTPSATAGGSMFPGRGRRSATLRRVYLGQRSGGAGAARQAAMPDCPGPSPLLPELLSPVNGQAAG